MQSFPGTARYRTEPFAPTHWTVILAAGSSEADPARAQSALAELCQIYWAPLYTFVRSRGYGVLVSSPARVAFELGTEHALRAQFTVPGEELDYFFIFGPNPKQVLNRLGALTGRPALPPAWSFGSWLSLAPRTRSNAHEVHELLEGMAARELPVHTLHFDDCWMNARDAGGFEWDTAAFPDPDALLARLKARGVHLSLALKPSMAESSPSVATSSRRRRESMRRVQALAVAKSRACSSRPSSARSASRSSPQRVRRWVV